MIKHKFRVKQAKKQREREKRTDGPEESCPAYSGEPIDEGCALLGVCECSTRVIIALQRNRVRTIKGALRRESPNLAACMTHACNLPISKLGLIRYRVAGNRACFR